MLIKWLRKIIIALITLEPSKLRILLNKFKVNAWNKRGSMSFI